MQTTLIQVRRSINDRHVCRPGLSNKRRSIARLYDITSLIIGPFPMMKGIQFGNNGAKTSERKQQQVVAVLALNLQSRSPWSRKGAGGLGRSVHLN